MNKNELDDIVSKLASLLDETKSVKQSYKKLELEDSDLTEVIRAFFKEYGKTPTDYVKESQSKTEDATAGQLGTAPTVGFNKKTESGQQLRKFKLADGSSPKVGDLITVPDKNWDDDKCKYLKKGAVYRVMGTEDGYLICATKGDFSTRELTKETTELCVLSESKKSESHKREAQGTKVLVTIDMRKLEDGIDFVQDMLINAGITIDDEDDRGTIVDLKCSGSDRAWKSVVKDYEDFMSGDVVGLKNIIGVSAVAIGRSESKKSESSDFGDFKYADGSKVKKGDLVKLKSSQYGHHASQDSIEDDWTVVSTDDSYRSPRLVLACNGQLKDFTISQVANMIKSKSSESKKSESLCTQILKKWNHK